MNKKQYPITMNDAKDRCERVADIFLKESPHNGAFIGVTVLEGTFFCESPNELYDSLEIGEKLMISKDEKIKTSIPAFNVSRLDGTYLGKLPYNASIIPNMLIKRGINVWCHTEVKEFDGIFLSLAVSLYCDKY